MKAISARTAKFLGMAGTPVAVMLVGAMVWSGSNAAFTAQTHNAGNSWAAGQVTLTDDDLGAAAFNAKDMVPGQKGSKCLVVTSGSTVPGQVRTYFKGLEASSKGLEDHLMLKIERGTGGTFNDCSGFKSEASTSELSLSRLAAAFTDYATAGSYSTWNVSGEPGESTTFRASWQFDTAGLNQAEVNALQGATTGLELVWELQNAEAK